MLSELGTDLLSPLIKGEARRAGGFLTTNPPPRFAGHLLSLRLREGQEKRRTIKIRQKSKKDGLDIKRDFFISIPANKKIKKIMCKETSKTNLSHDSVLEKIFSPSNGLNTAEGQITHHADDDK
jgi:hypothetical protein